MSEGKGLRSGLNSPDIKHPPATFRGRRMELADRHFAAVLVSRLTTWTRRLTPSLGSAAFFSLVLP
jgi:hypothetical protein